MIFFDIESDIVTNGNNAALTSLNGVAEVVQRVGSTRNYNCLAIVKLKQVYKYKMKPDNGIVTRYVLLRDNLRTEFALGFFFNLNPDFIIAQKSNVKPCVQTLHLHII